MQTIFHFIVDEKNVNVYGINNREIEIKTCRLSFDKALELQLTVQINFR